MVGCVGMSRNSTRFWIKSSGLCLFFANELNAIVSYCTQESFYNSPGGCVR